MNVYTLDQELDILKASVATLLERVDKAIERFDTKYEVLQTKVVNIEQLLNTKCEKQKCKKIMQKVNKTETKLINKLLKFKQVLAEIEESKCSKAHCEKMEIKVSNITANVETLAGNITNIITQTPSDCKGENLTLIHQLIEDLNKTKCSQVSCEALGSDMTSVRGDLDKVELEKCSVDYCDEISVSIGRMCGRDYCENTAIGLANVGQVVDSLFTTQEKLLEDLSEKCEKSHCELLGDSIEKLCSSENCQHIVEHETKIDQLIEDLNKTKCSQTSCEELGTEISSVRADLARVEEEKCDKADCQHIEANLRNLNSCMKDPSLEVCRAVYGAAGLSSQVSGLTDCFSSPSSQTCSSHFPQPSSLLSLLDSKCSSSVCSSLESCFTQPSGSQCVETYGTSVAPLGLVSVIPEIQGWLEVLRDPPKLQCSKTSNILPANLPTEGPENWLVNFDQCQDFQGTGETIKPMFDNSFFQINSSGDFFVSLTYLPVIFEGKPIRVWKFSLLLPSNISPAGFYPGGPRGGRRTRGVRSVLLSQEHHRGGRLLGGLLQHHHHQHHHHPPARPRGRGQTGLYW